MGVAVFLTEMCPKWLRAPLAFITELLAAIPEHNVGAVRLAALPGMVPGRDDRPKGCLFAPRCKYVVDDCTKARPALAPLQGHAEVARVRCIKPLNLSGDANVHTHGGAR